MMKSINDNKDDINPSFFSGLEEFKRLLRNVLVPKNSFNDGEVVTGEGEYGRSQELHLLMVHTGHLHMLHAHLTPVLFDLHWLSARYFYTNVCPCSGISL